MALQTWWSAASAIPFPMVIRPNANLTASCVQLRKLFWHAPAQKLVGVFVDTLVNFDLDDGIFLDWRLQYLWRDGQPVDLPIPMNGILANTLPITHTTDGRVVRAGDISQSVADTEILNAAGDALFVITTPWAQDIIAYPPVGARSIVSPYTQASVLRIQDQVGFRVSASLTARLIVVKEPDQTTMISLTSLTLFGAIRDFLWIDNETAAITTVTTNNSAALLHCVSVHDNGWTLKWSAELPGTDQVAAWDETNKILYSAGRYESNAVIHASWLRRAPASASVITLQEGGVVLDALHSSVLSVLITDSLGCGVCNYPVNWTLDPHISGGMLASAYSTTNDSGIATMIYVGPLLSTATITQVVSVTAWTIEPITRVR